MPITFPGGPVPPLVFPGGMAPRNPVQAPASPLQTSGPSANVPISVATKVTVPSIAPSAGAGPPLALTSLSASQQTVAQQNSVNCLVTVNFTHASTDANYWGVNLWLVKYHGSLNPLLIASGVTSPLAFTLDPTGETVTIYGQAVNATGVGLTLPQSLFTTVILSAAASAPPAPTVSQTLVSTPTGYQFTFNIESEPSGNIISNYNVYRNTANSLTGATIVRSIPQPKNASGTYVYQETVAFGTTYYYWVTAVDSSGNESAKTSAQSGAVASGTLGVSAPANLSYRPLSNPLSAIDAGSSATVTIAGFTMRIAGIGDIAVSGGSITGLAYGVDYYIYYNDPTALGGVVPYSYSTTKTDALAGAGYFFVGSILTPPAGGAATLGNNDGGAGAQNGLQGSIYATGFSTSGSSYEQWTNLSNAYDGNTSTYAYNAVGGTTETVVFFGFNGIAPLYTSLVLNVRTSATGQTSSDWTLSYSLNNGTTWTTIWNRGNINWADTVTVTLPKTQSISLIRVQLAPTVGQNTGAQCNFYEAWITAVA